MALAGYLFVTGSGDRGQLLEVMCYMIAGATCFFAGINYVYDSEHSFVDENIEINPEFEEVSPIQQQWRTIHIAKRPVKQVNNSFKNETVEVV